MLKNTIKNLKTYPEVVFRRFPVPVIFSVLFCIISISRLGERKEVYLTILFCGFFWFIALKLFAESRKWQSIRYYAVSSAIFLIIAWHLYTVISPFTFIFLGAGLFLSIFISPFLNRYANSENIWVFNYKLWIHICFTVFTAIILYLGIIAIVASVNFLFGTVFPSLIYRDLWLFIATLFSPIVAMGGIPERFDDKEKNYPKDLRIILSYIVIPIMFIYAVILYIYTAKILITWDLPNGGVAYMVTAFGCIGTISYLASYPLHNNKEIINSFSRYFFKILLLPLILLAVAIGVRMYQYGITEERYAILLCFIWLTMSAFFVIIKSGTDAPKFILSSIVILLFIALVGPLSAFNVSAFSQINRLESILEKNQILVNNKIHKTTQVLSRADRISISSIIGYIINTKKIHLIKPWFANLPNSHINKENKYYSEELIVQDIGIGYIKPYDRARDEDSYSFSFENDWLKPYLDISGYNYIINIGDYGYADFTKDIVLGDSGIKLSIKLDPSSNIYSVKLNANETIAFELSDLIKKLDIEKAKNLGSNKQSFAIEKESSNLVIRLIITRVYGEFKKDRDNPTISYIGTALLIKKKP